MNTTTINVIIGAATFLIALWGGNWWNQKFLERTLNELDGRFTARIETLRTDLLRETDKLRAELLREMEKISYKVDLLTERVTQLERRVAVLEEDMRSFFKPIGPRG